MKKNLTPIASGVALFLCSFAMSAYAQQADGKVQEVVTTGIRASLQQALTKKRNSDTVADVISAEDIGKLPDKNVADAVQRLPGVNISSSASGEGGFSENDRVSIRGTNSSLTQTLINGHAVGTGDWFVSDQVGTVGRSVSFALLPSEIVSAVVVQKSQQADMVEGGVAGSVNIETRNAARFQTTAHRRIVGAADLRRSGGQDRSAGQRPDQLEKRHRHFWRLGAVVFRGAP